MLSTCAKTVSLFAVLVLAASPLHADDPPSAVSSVMRLLKSGRVPPERLGPIVRIVCERGNEHDLAYVYSQVIEPGTYPAELRRDILAQLAEAARTRKVMPAGDLSGVTSLLMESDGALRANAVTLAGLWRIESALEPLQGIALAGDTADELRTSVLAALQRIDPQATLSTVELLIAADRPFTVREAGIAALASSDLPRAARLATDVLRSAEADEDPSRLIDAFLARQGGPETLAEAITRSPPSPDLAKLALRRMYSVGRSDPALSRALERVAGIEGDIEPPDAQELAAMIKAVESDGDPAHGESVFRRTDLSCLKCHSVSKAGGQVGPDLSALGSSSPIDYIIKSIFDPDAQIKEAFATRVVLTVDGLTVQGIFADSTDEQLVLKDANGKLHAIPLADIEEEIEGKSLMPKGLVKFMTESELIDLVSFLSQLGRPGEYAIRDTPRMQRWRVLSEPGPELVAGVPNEAIFEDQVLHADMWAPAYARVGGVLPIDDLRTAATSDVLYLRGDVDVTRAGPVGVRIEAPQSTHVWVDAEEFGAVAEVTVDLDVGLHAVVLRATEVMEGAGVRVELFSIPDSNAEFAVVDGA